MAKQKKDKKTNTELHEQYQKLEIIQGAPEKKADPALNLAPSCYS